jgi:hypothetical protein
LIHVSAASEHWLSAHATVPGNPSAIQIAADEAGLTQSVAYVSH